MSLYVTSDLRTLTSYHRGMADLQQAVKTHVSHLHKSCNNIVYVNTVYFNIVYFNTVYFNIVLQGVAVNAHVLDPFQCLLALFQDPLHLISKRRDKLLDFDHLQYALDHNSTCLITTLVIQYALDHNSTCLITTLVIQYALSSPHTVAV